MPGARDSYINLGRFYDSGRLEKRRSELRELTLRYKNAYALAYDYLAAAGTLHLNNERYASDEAVSVAVENCAKLLPCSVPGKSFSRRCFLDAFCGNGRLSLTDKYSNWHIYTVMASLADGSAVLSQLGKLLHNNAYGVIYCSSPLDPRLTRHLLIPQQKTIFSLSRFTDGHCAAALSPAPQPEALAETHENLLNSAAEMLTLAKRSHDALEEVYNPCVDFSGIYSEAEKHIAAVF